MQKGFYPNGRASDVFNAKTIEFEPLLTAKANIAKVI